jgi:hypothetical protein
MPSQAFSLSLYVNMCFLAGLVHNLIPYDPLVKEYIVYVKLSCMA